VVKAYVLIQTEPGTAGRGVSKEVAQVNGVVSSEDVSGPYDVIARAEAQSLDLLARVVVGRVQAIPGVLRTLICPVVRLHSVRGR
jgi:DNA-binding Lrp family transcriptional regulator